VQVGIGQSIQQSLNVTSTIAIRYEYSIEKARGPAADLGYIHTANQRSWIEVDGEIDLVLRYLFAAIHTFNYARLLMSHATAQIPCSGDIRTGVRESGREREC
jgi:hypothetical protein